jgi:hypothetical protein
MNNKFTPDFLASVTWNMNAHTHAFQTFFHINDKFKLSILKGGHSNSGGDTFEVALIHIASNDIVTVRDFRTVREIEKIVEQVQNQTL